MTQSRMLKKNPAPSPPAIDWNWNQSEKSSNPAIQTRLKQVNSIHSEENLTNQNSGLKSCSNLIDAGEFSHPPAIKKIYILVITAAAAAAAAEIESGAMRGDILRKLLSITSDTIQSESCEISTVQAVWPGETLAEVSPRSPLMASSERKLPTLIQQSFC